MGLIKWHLVVDFVATILIPFLYFYNLYLIYIYSESLNLIFVIRVVGIIIAVFGLCFWIISFINLGKSFGVLPQKQKRVTTGIYKYFRHPMYIGIWTSFLGLSLAFASLQGLLFLNLFMTPLLYIRAFLEDKKLN